MNSTTQTAPLAAASVSDARGQAVTLPSLPEAHRTIPVAKGASWVRKMLAFAGPGYLVAVGYMDPGNWATDIGGGSKFGYTLLSVIVISNFMAMLLQALSAKLGVATGRDLAQACREHYSRRTSFVLWVLCEIAIAACDLAEVLGSAVALKLLFGLPLIAGVLITALDVLVVLALQGRGFRMIEAFVVTLIASIAACFAYEIFVAQPLWREAARGLIPDDGDFAESRDALPRNRDFGRDGDAAQFVSAFEHRADASVWCLGAGSAGGAALFGAGFHDRAGIRAVYQRRDIDTGSGGISHARPCTTLRRFRTPISC